ncbi:glycosyltransferase family 4 protein [Oceanicola sp. S124]|uniref:glycosyltransferase family 4 protein n=1 Tax=Oceanicola sp. S124 TaxID=1042378 RepID=UPI0002557965|nr:glycosyltransferase family 1 protein [Oceanicola sp. S124]
MTTLYYDLSEQFLSSGIKLRYYGIARTVMEVGHELAGIDADVRFVIYSPAHERFFEITPRLGAESPTGVLDPGLPDAATPYRIRNTFPGENPLRDFLHPAFRHMVRRINLRRWRHIPAQSVREVDLHGQILVSLGRPKLLADYLTALERRGEKPRLVPMLHDMIPLYEFALSSSPGFTNTFSHDNAVVVERSERLLANSDFTRREILKMAADGYLPAPPPIVTVPLCHELRPTSEPVVKTGPDEPYLLCVGIQRGRKNLECVVEAMLALHEAGRPVPPLVLAGAPRKRNDSYLAGPRFAAIRDRIHHVVNPNEAELRHLYEGALALAMPSRMEGWGLPLGEALWLGTPGLAAEGNAALHEVGLDLAIYFDAEDPADLAGHIDRLQSDAEAREALRQRIRAARPRLRSWRDVARDLIRATTGPDGLGQRDALSGAAAE